VPGYAVTVQYYKYWGQAHWRHQMVMLGEDQHGVWLGAPVGALIQKGNEPAVAWERPFVQLIPTDEWWSLLYNADGGRMRVYVDIITPALWSAPDRVEMTDLDLDVVRFVDGTVEVLDQDEFAMHQTEFAYPKKLIDGALATSAEVRNALEARTEPFGDVGAVWLERLGLASQTMRH